jgi:hypothetical protein
MSDDFDQRLRDLEIGQATQAVVVANLATVVTDNTTAIRELTAVLNKGKGAVWVGAGLFTAVGFALSFVVSYFKG